MDAWIPLIQTIAWIALILFGAYKFKNHIDGLLSAIRLRVAQGAKIKVGPVELGEDLKSLERVKPSHKPAPPSEDDWSTERNSIYQRNRGFFLAHVIEPSSKHGQEYDIFIYLVRHKSDTFDDIDFAEFFLGSYWGNEVFCEKPKGRKIGISTAAYGPFLCTCKITFKDKESVSISRYIDFEMGRVFHDEG